MIKRIAAFLIALVLLVGMLPQAFAAEAAGNNIPDSEPIFAQPLVNTVADEYTDSFAQPSVVLLEQIRVIDKGRLDRRIGMLSEKSMRGIDNAIRVSVGLTAISQRIPLCLCHACAGKLIGTGIFYLRKSQQLQSERKLCGLCNHRMGYDYEMLRKKP